MVIALGFACWGILLSLAGAAFGLESLEYAAIVVSLLGLVVMVVYFTVDRFAVVERSAPRFRGTGLGSLQHGLQMAPSVAHARVEMH